MDSYGDSYGYGYGDREGYSYVEIIVTVIIIVVVVVIALYKQNGVYKNINNYEFKTGDIILTNENGFLGYFVTLFAGYKYSHCSIVVDGEKRLIAHSHILNNYKYDITPTMLIKSEIRKQYNIKNDGVLIESFDNYINRENVNRLVILPIKNEIDNTKMFNAYTQFMNKPYKESIIELINVNNNLYKNKRNNSSLFCSEFIVELLQYMKIIDKNIISNTISPDEILELGSHDKNKLVTINFNLNFDNKMFINGLLYRFLSFIRLPVTIINGFVSNI
jgi:hypothetical protein